MESRRLKALLFDLDGTVADTDPLHVKVFQKLFEPLGHNVTHEYFRLNMSGKHNPEIFRHHLPEGTPETEILEAGTAKEALWREMAEGELEPTHGLIQLLESAKANNIAMGAVTNAPKENADFLIKSLKLDRFFQFLILGDECSTAKPFPDPYLAGLNKAGVQPFEAIVFEDSPTGVRAGVSAGITTVGISSSQPAEVLRNEGATIVVRDFTQITLDSLEALLSSTNIQ